MNTDKLTGLANSDSAVESVKRLRPSSLFLILLVISVPILLYLFFREVKGYDLMVWMWFISTIITTGVAIYSYSIDMAAFAKRNNYEKAES